jgi:hypothetical protein
MNGCINAAVPGPARVTLPHFYSPERFVYILRKYYHLPDILFTARIFFVLFFHNMLFTGHKNIYGAERRLNWYGAEAPGCLQYIIPELEIRINIKF